MKSPTERKETNTMRLLPISKIPMIEEEEATGEVAQIYDEMKRELEMPFITNGIKSLSGSVPVLNIYWAMLRSFYQHSTLPEALVHMILFCIATAKNCQYCRVGNQVVCRALGIDDETLEALARDLDAVSPQRIQETIKFALKCALDPQSLVEADYDRVREQGVSDEELVEIILLAAVGNFNDTLSDALKIEVDQRYLEALKGV
jgi:alkylhydroperoxidase family enzyme